MKVMRVIASDIIAQLKKGVAPWRRPWYGTGGLAVNHRSGRAYRGINQFCLTLSTMAKEYEHNEWLTYKQAMDLECPVKKGEKSTPVLFWKTREEEQADGSTKEIPFARYYRVFNVDQLVKLPDTIEMPEPATEFEQHMNSDALMRRWFRGEGPKLEHAGQRAYYSFTRDVVKLPPKDKFKTRAGYYSTAFHEMVHSTGHKLRLDRKGSGFDLTRDNYAFEELIAEIGASFMCWEVGLHRSELEMLDSNAAAYCEGWAEKLGQDPSWLWRASRAAQAGVDMIYGGQLEHLCSVCRIKLRSMSEKWAGICPSCDVEYGTHIDKVAAESEVG